MIVRLLRLAILLEVLLSCCKSYHSPFSFPGDYQSIKEVLRFAKNDPSLINHASMIAKDYISQNSIQNIKDAMCCVSIFKLADDTASAMKVIENMDTRNLKADTFLYNNVISVCTKTKDWRQAIELLLIMQNKGVTSDTISFSSAISACAKAGRWRESLNLLNEMTIAGIAADTICYSSAISACAVESNTITDCLESGPSRVGCCFCFCCCCCCCWSSLAFRWSICCLAAGQDSEAART